MLLKQTLLPLIISIVSYFAVIHLGHASETTSADTTAASSDESTIQIQQEIPLQDLRTFTEIFERIRNSYVEEIDDKTLFNNAIKGMLNSLDPHSTYLQEEDFSDLRESTSGKFGGLGIEVGMESGLVRVITPIDGTPAEKAGVRAGDLIVSLDGEAVMGLSLSEAVERMRGEPGTTITIEVSRAGEQELRSITIERAEIKVASVRTEILDSDIGYVRLTQFQENTGDELTEVLQEWQQTTELNGLILDMRNNPGGVLQAAVGVVDAFLSEGLIVYTEGRSTLSDIRYHAGNDTIMPNIPIVVLINGGSASASEIVAGALQDHGRAVIVGTRSFGKGSVQTVLPVSETAAVKLTTARYFTPDGRSIQAQGIIPDIVVEQSEVTPNEQKFYKESDLRGHLENTNDGDKSVTSDAHSDEIIENDDLISRDFQLYEAHTLLRGVAILAPKSEMPTKSEQ